MSSQMAPKKATSTEVWTEFNNGGGWPSTALSVFVGLIGSVFANNGINTLLEYLSQCRLAYDGLPRYRLRCACESANSRPVLPYILTDLNFSLDG